MTDLTPLSNLKCCRVRARVAVQCFESNSGACATTCVLQERLQGCQVLKCWLTLSKLGNQRLHGWRLLLLLLTLR